MAIRIGVGGWVYPEWRETFYPKGVTQKRELEYASRAFSAIEVNGTYYGSQKPESFKHWHDETPDDFVFALKGPRFATNRRNLGEAGPSIERFFESGVGNLKKKLGPINWQFMATKKFDIEDFTRFLDLLPKKLDGIALRHAVEVRHESFKSPDFVTLCRKYKVAIVAGCDSDFPCIADVTTDFIYARIMGTTAKEKTGYAKPALAKWAKRATAWERGKSPTDLKLVAKAAPVAKRDVFLFVIAGAKEKNPSAAIELIKLAKEK